MVGGRVTIASGAGLLACLWGCSSGAAGGHLRASQPDPLRAGRLNAEGLALVEQHQLAAAQAKFRQALAADPFCGPAHANLGAVLIPEHPFEAAGELRYACALLLRASQPRANLGLLYAAAGRVGPAEDALREALALAPDDLEIIGELARLRLRLGQIDDQTRAWLKAVATQDDDPAWRDWAGTQLTRLENEHPAIGR